LKILIILYRIKKGSRSNKKIKYFLGLDCCPIISIKFYPICVTAVIIFRTTPTLSTFPFPNKMFFIAGKALRRKGLGHRKKS